VAVSIFDTYWITGEINPAIKPPYAVGNNIDLSHCAKLTCDGNYSGARVGLNFVKCRSCGADAIVNIGGSGYLKLACKLEQ
jgi:hypothetical protein